MLLFIALAPLKVRSRVVTEDVSHFEISPLNDAALGLQPVALLILSHADPPVSSLIWEKAKLKSLMSLTSQSTMSPHLSVAVAVFWTQSGVGGKGEWIYQVRGVDKQHNFGGGG